MVASTPSAPSVPPSQGDRLSLADYWQQETIADQRHEYHDGIRVAMAGGSEAHSKIAVNLVAFLHFALRDTDWQVYNSDLRVGFLTLAAALIRMGWWCGESQNFTAIAMTKF